SIGWCLNRLGEHEAAIGFYQRVVEKVPNWAIPHANRAAALAELGRTKDAVEELRRAFRMDFPGEADHPAFWRNRLGTWLAELGAYEEAIDELELAVQLNPNEPATHYSLGTTYSQLQRYDKSLEHLQKAAKLDPSWADTYAQLGFVLREIGEFDKAVEAYLQV